MLPDDDDPFVPMRKPLAVVQTGIPPGGFPGGSRCTVCNRPLTVHQQVSGGICSRSYCRQQRIIEAARRTRELADRKKRERAVELCAATRERTGMDWPADLAVFVVPANYAGVTSLPETRKAGIKAHIDKTAADYIKESRRPEEQVTESVHPFTVLEVRERDLPTLGSACATCRGHCCRTGGEHAYITTKTVKDYLKSHPDSAPEDVAGVYMAFLPRESYENGCVFQGSRGCTLPREIRSDTCNLFLCAPLRNIQNHLENGGTRELFAVAKNGEQIFHSGRISDGKLTDFEEHEP